MLQKQMLDVGLLEHWLGAPLGPVGAPSSPEAVRCAQRPELVSHVALDTRA